MEKYSTCYSGLIYFNHATGDYCCSICTDRISGYVKKYKWNSAHEWLLDAMEKWDINQLKCEFREIMMKMDSDEIQDIYQSDMDADGYFDEIE